VAASGTSGLRRQQQDKARRRCAAAQEFVVWLNMALLQRLRLSLIFRGRLAPLKLGCVRFLLEGL
jgi:hypothetical protein